VYDEVQDEAGYPFRYQRPGEQSAGKDTVVSDTVQENDQRSLAFMLRLKELTTDDTAFLITDARCRREIN